MNTLFGLRLGWISLGLMSFALLTTAQAWQSVRKDSPQPDVYLVTIDTLRADHIHCYGDSHIDTPNLDSLARDGIRFTSAFTPSPITNTSHVSILTGLLPSVHGVTDFAIPLASTHPTWAELLKRSGYQTAAFPGAVILDAHSLAPGLDRGFDFYDEFPTQPASGRHWGYIERRGEDVVHRAETWMNAHTTRPRFVWLHLYDPHDPYEPPPPYAQIYKDRLYDGEIAYADSALGSLIRYLKLHHRYQNALMIVVGDHGEGLGEHGEETHGIFLYDTTMHVPLIVKLPLPTAVPVHFPTTALKVVNAQVQTTDLLPTVLDLLQIAPPPTLVGRSLAAVLAGDDQTDRVTFGETLYPLHFGWAPLRAIRANGFKFIEAPRPELYNLSVDPGEVTNTYEPWNGNVQQLRDALVSSPVKAPVSAASKGAAGNDKLAELRALGYLGPADERTSTSVPELSSLPDAKDKIREQNLLHSAMIRMDTREFGAARPLLESVLKLDPDSIAALRQLAELEVRIGNYREATNYFEHIHRVHPDSLPDGPAAISESIALERVGDLSGARAVLEATVQRFPGQHELRLSLARIDRKLGDKQAAEDQYAAVLLLNPSSQEATRGLAKVYLDESRFGEALDLLLPLTKANATTAEDYRILAEAYRGLGKSMEAHRATARASMLDHRK